MSDHAADPIAALLRRADPDRYFTALFAPSARRPTLMLLYAFHHELARAREVAAEPMMALIRLQWWREVVQGAWRRHEVAAPLAAALAEGALDAGDLLAMVNGREAECEPELATMADWRTYVSATAGGVARAAGRLLGADGATRERLAVLGSAYGVAGQLRNIASLAARGRCLLPQAVLALHGLSVHEVIAAPDDPRLRPVRHELAAHGHKLLLAARGAVPRPLIAAALPATLARRDLARLDGATRPRGLADRLAVLRSYAAARV